MREIVSFASHPPLPLPFPEQRIGGRRTRIHSAGPMFFPLLVVLALAAGTTHGSLVHHCAHDRLPEVRIQPVGAPQAYHGVDAR